MSFEHLPKDWPMRSLSQEPLARDVVDLVVTMRDRRRGGIAMLLCGPAGRLVQPVFVTDATPAADLQQDHPVATAAIELLEHGERPGSLLFAIARRGGALNDTDRRWHQRAIESCRRAGIELLGVHLVTEDGVTTLPRVRQPAA